MADGPKKCDPGYTPVSVHDYLVEVDKRYTVQFEEMDARFRDSLEAAKDAVRTAMTSSEKAVAKAELAAEKRFEAVNEFRGQLNDQVKTFIPRLEVDQRLAVLTERVSNLESRDFGRAGAEKKSETNLGLIFGIAGLLVGIGTMIATAAIIFVKH